MELLICFLLPSVLCHRQICLLGVLFKRICLIAHIYVKLAKSAVTAWQAANVGHTRVSLSASVKRAIMGKVCSMNAQVSLQFVCNCTSYLLLCKKKDPRTQWLNTLVYWLVG